MSRLLISVFLLMSASHAFAVRVTELYEAAVPVKNQDPSTRAAALRGVLRSVIVKLTGQSVLPATLLQRSLQIEHMVEQFGYESRQTSTGTQRRLYLWAKLNPTGVKQLIRQVGLPLWPEERPATLVWLAIDDQAGRQVMAEDSPHQVVKHLYEAANLRGLPVVLPLMDLQESSKVDYEAITTMRAETLQQPSAKYGSEHVLVGSIQRLDDGRWRGRWKILDSAEPVMVTPAGSLADVIASGVNPLASRIARQFSSYAYADGEQYIDIAIDDINGTADYARSLKYLQSLSLVSQVDVVGTDRHRMIFRLHTRADLASVLQVIELGRVLYTRDVIDQLVFGLNP